jgi:hypothetical protein
MCLFSVGLFSQDAKGTPPKVIPKPVEPTPILVVTAPDITEINVKQLYMLMWEKYKVKAMIESHSFWLPSKEFVLDVISPDVFTFLGQEKLYVYQNKFDCVQYTRAYMMVGQIDYIHYQPDGEMKRIAIGQVCYKPDPGKFEVPKGFENEGHSINIVVLMNGETIFIEPQTGKEIELSVTEIKSIFFIEF